MVEVAAVAATVDFGTEELEDGLDMVVQGLGHDDLDLLDLGDDGDVGSKGEEIELEQVEWTCCSVVLVVSVFIIFPLSYLSSSYKTLACSGC